MNDKQAIRLEMLARRDRMPAEERIEKSLAMADHASEINALPGEIVSGFLPIRSEPDLRPLMARLRDFGARLCLPVVLDRQTIVFRDFSRDVELVETGFGTRGPAPQAQVLDPDILLMPLSAFDTKGNRLGYGAGHYDRAIFRLVTEGRAPRLIGVGYDFQEVPAIPAEPHDVPLDMILTESGLRSLRQRL